MLLAIGTQGGVSWRMTREIFVRDYYDLVKIRKYNISQFAGRRDFGAGYEFSFRCNMCYRVLPMAIVEADHIIPRTNINIIESKKGDKITRTYTRTRKNYNVPEKGKIDLILIGSTSYDLHTGDFECFNNNNVYTINIEVCKKTFNQLNLMSVLQNDIDNLQLLCSHCNRAKGRR